MIEFVAMAEPMQALAISQMSDEDLLRICPSQPYDSPEWEELSKRCLEKLSQIFSHFVFQRNFFPPGIDRNEFVNDCVSGLMQKLLRVLRTDPPGNLSSCLWTAAKNFLIDQYRAHGGPREKSGKEQPTADTEQLPLDKEQLATGTKRKLEPPVNIDDIDLIDRQDVPPEAGSWAEQGPRKDPSLVVQVRERREIIDTLLTVHGVSGSKRDKDCSLWIRENLNGTNITEIAERRGTTKDDVWAMFKHDYKSLYEICKERYPTVRLKDFGI